jgi:hypothetical protein
MTQSTAATVPTASAALPIPPDDVFDHLREQVQQRLQAFRQQPVTPLAAQALEQDLRLLLDEVGRQVLQAEFQHCEPADKAQAAPRVRFHKDIYRINKRTPTTVATRFGPITLWSFLYLPAVEGSPCLHPLLVRLGIVAGATSVLAERVARWAVEHSQSIVRALLAQEHGLRWSPSRVRRLLAAVHQQFAPLRQDCQRQQLLGWLAQATRPRGPQPPVLAAGRDGITVPIRGQGNQQASVATVSVYDRRGRRLGTVYLGQLPEAKQKTLSGQLTDLLTAVLQRWSGQMPRLVYVTDKGKAEDEYWRVLRKLKTPCHPEQRLSWQWVLDFYHVSGYVSQLGDALFGQGDARGRQWYACMRRWLRDRPQGVAQVLRSAMQHYNRRGLSAAATKAFWKAYRYLRKHSRWMEYAQYRQQGLPLGSGVTEAACKTVFTQRLKRSGMRWHKSSAQVIVDLRVLFLSGLWEKVVHKDRQTRPQVEPLPKASPRPQPPRTRKKAS